MNYEILIKSPLRALSFNFRIIALAYFVGSLVSQSVCGYTSSVVTVRLYLAGGDGAVVTQLEHTSIASQASSKGATTFEHTASSGKASYELRTRACVSVLNGSPHATSCAVALAGTCLAIGCRTGNIVVMDFASKERSHRAPGRLATQPADKCPFTAALV